MLRRKKNWSWSTSSLKPSTFTECQNARYTLLRTLNLNKNGTNEISEKKLLTSWFKNKCSFVIRRHSRDRNNGELFLVHRNVKNTLYPPISRKIVFLGVSSSSCKASRRSYSSKTKLSKEYIFFYLFLIRRRIK